MTLTLKAKREKFQALYAELDAMKAKGLDTMSEEEAKDFDAKYKQASEIKVEIKAAEDRIGRLEGLTKLEESQLNTIRHVAGELQPEARREADLRARRCGRLRAFKDERTAMRFGMWFLASIFGNPRAAAFCRENGLDVKAVANETTNTQGAHLVPEEFDATAIDLRERYGLFRRYAKIVPMAREVKSMPRRTGGLTAYVVGEQAIITPSTKAWDRVQLVAQKIGAIQVVSNELNADAAINIADDTISELAYAFSNFEDSAGFIGDGTSTYAGVSGLMGAATGNIWLRMNGGSPTIANIAGLVVGTGNAYSELTLLDFQKVIALLPQYADDEEAAWYVHRTFYFQVMQPLIQTASGGLTLSELQAGGRVPLFLGYPVRFSQVAPKAEANSQVCAILGKLALSSALGDRQQTTISIAEQAYVNSQSLWERDEIGIRGIERIAIVNHDVGNYHATAASRVPGPVVGLITAAS